MKLSDAAKWSKVVLSAGVGLGLFLLPMLVAFFEGSCGCTSRRVHHDHALDLPATASRLDCYQFISLTTLLDGTNEATFVMAKQDLPSLTSQIEVFPPSSMAARDPRYKVPGPLPADFGAQVADYQGMSAGNPCSILIYEVASDAAVGVYVRTRVN